MSTSPTTDNTDVNAGAGGDSIADEVILVGDTRGDQGLSQATYKIQRVKIAVGGLHEDRGDVTSDRPLAVESQREAELTELRFLTDLSTQRASLANRHTERYPLIVGQRTGRDGRY